MQRVWLAFILALALAACANNPSAPSDYASLPAMGNADMGKALFDHGAKNAQACSSCHAIDGPAEVGPSLKGIASRAASRVSGQSADVYLYNSMVRPDDFLVVGYAGGVMPKNYGAVLSPQQLRDLIVYLDTLS